MSLVTWDPFREWHAARSVAELQEGDPLVLVLARGGFCPKDRRQHEGLVQLSREAEVGYCRLVTISTDNLIETNEFRTGVGAHCLPNETEPPCHAKSRRRPT